MYVIMGGTGHVGSAVADTLLDRGVPVGIVTHDAEKAEGWVAKGAAIFEADVTNVASLRAALQRGQRAFLLNPPADVTSDTDAVELAQVKSILNALDNSGLEKVVVESTAGAQKGERLGDLSVLWELEQGLRSRPIPAAVNRAAYYMSNWDQQLEAVRSTGKLQTMFPASLGIPMVAPRDLGRIAAERIMAPVSDAALRYVEGPERYSASDVADVFSDILGQPVEVVVTPRDKWKEAYLKLGFSEPAAESYTRMTAASVDQGFDFGKESMRGTITLRDYLQELVDRP